MIDAISFEIFVSYSHKDARFVKPLIQYLLPTGSSVFRDEEAIRPGKKWAVVIAEAIEGCSVVYLFWCNHSAGSVEVQKEYEYAIALDKDIVPVLLDETPLTPDLKEYQWVDLRVVIGKHEDVVEESISLEEGESRRYGKLPKGAVGYPDPLGLSEDKFWDQGWREKRNKYVRDVNVKREVPNKAIQHAAKLVKENIESRLK